MTGERDLDHEMKRFALDDLTADRLLSGQIAPEDAPPGYGPIADAVQTAAAPGPAPDAGREAATVAALRSDRPADLSVRRKSKHGRVRGAKVAAIAAAAVFGATAAAAATNTLPEQAQTAISDVGSHVGLSIPKPNSHANAHATAKHGKPDDVGTTGPSGSTGQAVGPVLPGSALYGLCTAYLAGPPPANTHSGKHSSIAFSNLKKAAGTADVTTYCQEVVALKERLMSNDLKEIEQMAKSLTPEERARLAEILLESLQQPPAANIKAAWDREIKQRIAAYERGKLQTISAEDVFAKARRLAK